MFKFKVIFLVLYLSITQITSVYAYELENGMEYDTEIAQMPSSPVYNSGAVVLMDAATGLVLYEHNAREPKYPASITKVMTALVVIEHTYNLQERVQFSDHAVFSIPRNSSHIAMDVGETLTVEQALYGLMLASANEVSLALAEHVAGSVEGFVDLMNRRAMSLGATHTYFANPSGLPAPGHVTTAYDMALIMRAAVQHPEFTRIISARRFDIPPTERQSQVRELLNTNRMIQPGAFFNEYVVGGKTGWTNDAGHTLVSYAAQNDRGLIATILDAESAGTFADTDALFAFGFELPFEEVTVFDAADYALTIPVYQDINGNSTEIGRVPILATRDLIFELPLGFDPSWLRYELSIPETLTPPIRKDAEVGGVAVYVQNIRVGEVMLLAQEEVLAYSPRPADETPVPQTPAYTAYHGYLTDAYEYASEYYTSTLDYMLDNYVLTFAVPLGLSAVTLAISLVIYLTRRKRRMRRMLHARYARYPHYYRYR